MDATLSPDALDEGSSTSLQFVDSFTDCDTTLTTPPKKEKKIYTSVFERCPTPESDASNSNEESPDKAQKCEGILENLIKSEIHKINKNYSRIKKRRKHRSSTEKAKLNDLAEQELCESTKILPNASGDTLPKMEKLVHESDAKPIQPEENGNTTLTKELSDRFASITEDLNILNTHGGAGDASADENAAKLYTGPYGRIKSPFKKFSSLKTFSKGVKRSQRKCPGPLVKRPKLQESSGSEEDEPSIIKQSSPEGLEKSSPEPLEKSLPERTALQCEHNLSGDVEASSDDESQGEQLQIVEDADDDDEWSDVEGTENDIDAKLKSKSAKFSLSAFNVKSIIHKILTDENVVEMVRKAVHQKFEENETKFEPKMTRSKVKETLETDGNLPQMWGISPQKKPPDKSSFLDIELPEEEEDDEDFDPNTVPPDSDEDSESVVSSSCLSDLDSTMPSTPTSPWAPSTPTTVKPHTPIQADSDNSQGLLSPMGPPLQNKVPKSSNSSLLARKYHEAMEKDEERHEQELIARRTRSKYPLTDQSVYELEANLVAPDFSDDLYNTACDDSEWNDFLRTLVREPEPAAVTEDSVDPTGEEEDPEYDYLQEAENEDYDKEDFRDDRAVKVSKKELHLLMDELYDAYSDLYGEKDPLDAECKKTIKAQTQKFLETSQQKEDSQFQQSLVLQVGEHERRQIDDQMRKHVQLLTQTFVMAQTGIEEHKVISNTAEMYLNEINRFADLSEKMYPRTAYRTCNLVHAIDIIQDPCWKQPAAQDTEDKDEEEKEKDALVPVFRCENLTLPSLNDRQMRILWTNHCFMFIDLLPHGSFFKMKEQKKDRARVKFLEAEDNLLAMGLDQFKDLGDPKQFIHQFMLPCKTKKQIQIRIKNLNANSSKDNPVKFWKKYKQLPVIPQHAPVFDPSEMKAPSDRPEVPMDQLPSWCYVFRADGERQPQVARRVRRKRSKQSSSFSMTSTGITAVYYPPNSASAPVTPSHCQTDSSSQMGSSGSSLGSPSSDSQSAKHRMEGLHRKRLDLDVKPANTPTSGSGSSSTIPVSTTSASGMFVPLTVHNQSNPITICMMDNIAPGSIRPAGSSSSSQVLNTNLLPQSQASRTCVAPTIIIINNSGPVMTKPSMTQSMVPVSSSYAVPSSATVDTITNSGDACSASLPLTNTCVISTASFPSTGDTNVSPVEGKDALQTALLSANIIDTDSSNNADVSNEADVSVDASVSGIQAEVENNMKQSVEEEASQSLSNSVISSSCQTTHVSTGSTTNDSAIVSPSENWSVSTPTHSVTDTEDHQFQITPEQHTPTNSVCSSSEGTPKSALEIMASYAPYFISSTERPSKPSSQQQRLETTPKKSGGRYARLAPKSTPPQETTPTKTYIFEKKRSSPTKKPVHPVQQKPILPKGYITSPRKKELQQKARSILPKGFVVSTFDNSPTKRAASSLIGKAKQLQNKSSGFGNVLEGFRKILPHPSRAGRVTSTMDVAQNGIDAVSIGYGGGAGEKRGKRKFADSLESMETDDTAGEGEDTVGDGDDTGMDDNTGDTESDYTQSEDGNETQEDSQGEEIDSQGEELDSQGEELDSQEEEPDEDDDAHIANLMQASTTVRSDFSQDEVSKVRMCKKDRDRDISLAMLAPDIIESDPQRDYRDTAFAQAYLHKVKKTLRDDMDTLETFLTLMYNFSKTNDSPVRLYRSLSELFAGYPDLMTDFAGFLLPEQAMACDCYHTHNEFSMARTFLRKLEIYFSKTPHQFQKVMKIFSRWYRKPGRRVSDLRDQVEPMLKGQRYLLEEFSRFFPEEQPPDSAMDEFEEVNLENSGDEEEKCDSVEEIELLADDETLGTKRCPCGCHDDGDDHYKKKKKHCYRCCLTVIDGELVYRVNKSTIKRVNVTFGPSVRAADFVSPQPDDLSPGPPVDTQPSSTDEVVISPDRGLGGEQGREAVAEHMAGETTMGGADWLSDNEAAEKENIEDYHLTRSPKKHDKSKSGHKKKQASESSHKPSSPQKMTRVTWPAASSKWVRLSDELPSSVHTQSRPSQPVSSESMAQATAGSSQVTVASSGDAHVDAVSTSIQTDTSSKDSTCCGTQQVESLLDVSNQHQDSTPQLVSTQKIGINQQRPSAVHVSDEQNSSKPASKQEIASTGKVVSTQEVLEQISSSQVVQPSAMQQIEFSHSKIGVLGTSKQGSQQIFAHPLAKVKELDKDGSVSEGSIKDSGQTSDILATAFSSAMMTEVSLDSSSLPFTVQVSPDKGPTSSVQSVPTITNFGLLSVSNVQSLSVQSVSNVQSSGTAVQSSLSSLSSSTSPPSSQVISPKPLAAVSICAPTISAPDGKESLNISVASSFQKIDNLVSESSAAPKIQTEVSEQDTEVPTDKLDGTALNSVKSPVFSPFSPYASEVQAINSMPSPLASISSPNSAWCKAADKKIRRITPIQVSENSQQSNSSFQSVVQNSPLICDHLIPESPFEKFGKGVEESVPNPIALEEFKSGDSSVKDEDVPSSKSDSQSQQSNLLSTSQKSDSTIKSSSSDSVEVQPSNIQISEPVIHSEDANEEFPTVASTSASSALLSEESLLQCLGKDAKFDDHIHTISNLTNILHALEEKSVHSRLRMTPKKVAKVEERNFVSGDRTVWENPTLDSKGAVNVSENLLAEASKFSDTLTAPLLAKDNVCAKTSAIQDNTEACAKQSDFQSSDRRVGVSSVHSSEAQSSVGVGSGVTGGDAGNTDLSDSDVADKTLTPEKREEVDKQAVDNETVTEKGKFNLSSSSASNGSSSSTSSTSTTTETQETNCPEEIMKPRHDVADPDKNENNDSQVEPALGQYSESDKDHSDWTYKPKYRDKDQAADKSPVVHEETTEKTGANVTAPALSVCDKSEVEDAGKELLEKRLNQERSDSKLLSPPSSVEASEPPTSAKGDGNSGKTKRHKDKHKRKKSKKEKRHGEKSGKTVMERVKQFSCTSMAPGKMSPSMYGQGTSGEVDTSLSQDAAQGGREPETKVDVSSPGQVSSAEGDMEDQASGATAAVDLCSNNSSPCSSTEGPPEWSKDTDKTILEACKAHGIREKTFVKIAKQIGNVTPKQVRRRFNQLYKLILRPISKQAGRDTTATGDGKAKDTDTKGSPTS